MTLSGQPQDAGVQPELLTGPLTGDTRKRAGKPTGQRPGGPG
ncbi:hypothetical protein ABZY03_30015 [Streptomyces klenkii]